MDIRLYVDFLSFGEFGSYYYLFFVCRSSSTFCSRVVDGQTRHLSVCWRGMEKHQRKIVVRVAALSALNLLSHMCMLLGLLVVFVAPQKVAMTLGMLSTIWPLYVYAWRDKKFREKLKYVLAFIFVVGIGK